MIRFLQVILLLSFFSVSINAQLYKTKYNIKLKKDKTEKILVKYEGIEKLFKFRWTLYHNDGLVVLRSYDEAVAQNILYLNHVNQSVRVELKTRAGGFYSLPYIILKFVKFDYQTQEAVFELFLFDKKEQIDLKFLTKEALQG
ncbi:hypothetical protein [Sulfurimonas sp. HSL-1716]|uniref:hypothetical protein n=1 Tax=Hydrocurvibacter sulfurireducens TaxID=3131937 RepID=UPI0031F9A6F4